MISIKTIEAQLKAVGFTSRFWGRPEVLELPHILKEGECIQACLNGRYEGGFATFVATDQRLLLIDKKPFYLTVEDMRYDMISEVDFSSQVVSATLSICTPTKTMAFTAYRPTQLRELATHIQHRVMDIRQQFGLHLEQQGVAMPQSVAFATVPTLAPMPQMAGMVNPNLVADGAAMPVVAPAPAMTIEQPPVATTQPIIAADEPLAPVTQPIAQTDSPLSAMVEVTELPIPLRRNPYMGAPLMMRRRVGRFGPIASAVKSS